MEIAEFLVEVRKVFEKRKELYKGICVMAALVKEEGKWRNLICLMIPSKDLVANEKILDYGEFVILESQLTLENFSTFISVLSEDKILKVGNYQIDLSGGEMFPDLIFSYPRGDNLISSLGSGDIERMGVRWPSKGFVIGNTQHKGLPNIPLTHWVRKSLPTYQSVLSAIENEFRIPGFTSTPYYLGRIFFLLPDYRARFTKIVIRRDSVLVRLEVSPKLKEKLLIKYMNQIPLNEEHPSNELPVTSDSIEIQLNGSPSSFYCYLITESFEVVDIVRYEENYGYFTRDWIEYEEGSERIEYLASLGESQLLEYKRNLGDHDRFLRAIVAFSNTNDGTILIGVDDDGSIVGCNNVTTSQIEQSVRDKIQPFVKTEIESVKHDDKPIIIVRVSEGTEKPYYLRTGNSLTPYVRRNASDVPMQYNEIEGTYESKFRH